MSIRRIGIPALPAGFTDEQAQFFQAMKQNIERLDRELQEARADILNSLIHGAESVHDIGVGSGVVTLNPENGFLQKIINNGAFTLQPPPTEAFIRLMVIEGPADGAITTSGFNTVAGSYTGHGTGSAYLATVVVINGISWLRWDRAK